MPKSESDFCWVMLLISVPVLIVVTVVMTVVFYLKCSEQGRQTNSSGLPGLSGFLRFRNTDDYSAILDVPISDFVEWKAELEPKKVTNVTAFSRLLDLQNGNYNKFSNNTTVKYLTNAYAYVNDPTGMFAVKAFAPFDSNNYFFAYNSIDTKHAIDIWSEFPVKFLAVLRPLTLRLYMIEREDKGVKQYALTHYFDCPLTNFVSLTMLKSQGTALKDVWQTKGFYYGIDLCYLSQQHYATFNDANATPVGPQNVDAFEVISSEAKPVPINLFLATDCLVQKPDQDTPTSSSIVKLLPDSGQLVKVNEKKIQFIGF